MRAFVAVFLREIQEHNLVFLVGLFLALVAIAAPVLSLTSDSATDIREATAMALAFAYALILAASLGLTGIASELGSSRHAFFVARPIGSAELLGGKLAAAFVLIAGGAVVAASPAATRVLEITPGWNMTFAGFRVELAILCVGSAIAVFLILGFSHFVALALRARSAWLAFDLVWITVVAALGLWSFGSLEQAHALAVWPWLLLLNLLLLTGALLVAWSFQVAKGRVDLEHSHRWMSGVLGSLALVIAASMAWQAYEASNPEPSEIWALDDVRSASNEWIFVQGQAGPTRRFRPSFFWNPDTGKYLHLPSARLVTFTQDRSRAVWLAHAEARSENEDLYSIDLSGREPLPVKSPATLSSSVRHIALTPSGSLAALGGPEGIRIVEIESGVQVSKRAPLEGFVHGLSFRDAETLLVLRMLRLDFRQATLAIDTIALGDAGDTTFKTVLLPSWKQAIRWHVSGQTLLAGSRLFDLSTGETLADLGSDDSENVSYELLSDGRIVGFSPGLDQSALDLYNSSGDPLRSFQLPPGRELWIGGRPLEDRLIFTVGPDSKDGWMIWKTYVLDLESGVHRYLGPVGPVSRPHEKPGTRSTDLFVDESSGLVEIAEDGTRTQLIQGRLKTRFRGQR